MTETLKQKMKNRLNGMKAQRCNITIEEKKNEHPTITHLLQLLSDLKAKKANVEIPTVMQTLPNDQYDKFHEAVLNKFGTKSPQFIYACAIIERSKKLQLKDFISNMIKKNQPQLEVVIPTTPTIVTEKDGKIRKKFQLVT